MKKHIAYGEKRGTNKVRRHFPSKTSLCYCMDCDMDRRNALAGRARKKRARQTAKKEIRSMSYD